MKTACENSGATPVWPADYELDAGEIRVLDGEGRVAANVGEDVYMIGAEVGSPDDLLAVDEQAPRELQERCPGNYWILGPQVKIPRRGDLGRVVELQSAHAPP